MIWRLYRLKFGMLLYKDLKMKFNTCHRICYCYISGKFVGILEAPTFSCYCNIRLATN